MDAAQANALFAMYFKHYAAHDFDAMIGSSIHADFVYKNEDGGDMPFAKFREQLAAMRAMGIKGPTDKYTIESTAFNAETQQLHYKVVMDMGPWEGKVPPPLGTGQDITGKWAKGARQFGVLSFKDGLIASSDQKTDDIMKMLKDVPSVCA